MTLDMVRELVYDALREYKYLAIRDLSLDEARQSLVLTLEDGSEFELHIREECVN